MSTPDTRYHASIFQSKTAGLFALVFDNYEQGEHFYNSVSNAFGSAGRAMDVLSALHSPISFDYGIPYPPFSEHEEGLICTLNAWIATKEEEKKDNLQTLREEERSWNTFLTKINTLRETLQSSSSSSTLPGEDIDSLLSSIEESARFYNGFFRSNLTDFKEDENDGSETERRKKKKKQKEEGKLKVESSSSSSSVTSSSSFLNSKKVIENTLPISRSHSMNYEEEKRKSKHKGSSSAKKKDKGSSTSSKQRKSKKDELYSDSHSVIVTRDRREGSPRGSRKG